MKLKHSAEEMKMVGSLLFSAALAACTSNAGSNNIELGRGDAEIGQVQLVDSGNVSDQGDAGSNIIEETLGDSGIGDAQLGDSGNNSDLPTSTPVLLLSVSANRVLPNRTFAVIGVVRAGARQALAEEIQLSVTTNGSIVGGPNMKTICTGNVPVGSFIETGNLLIPASADTQVGRVVLSDSSSCPSGYQDSGMRISLIHTQLDQPSANQMIFVSGRAVYGSTILTSSTNIQLTRFTEPGPGPGLAFESHVAALDRPTAGQDFSVVIFPRSTYDYGLPCMPHDSVSGIEADAIAGCTVATNGGRSVPPNESLTINQPMPAGTAGALTIGPDANNVAIFTRGLRDATPVSFTHIGGGAYIFTMRGHSTPGDGFWSARLYNHTGGVIDTILQRVTIAQPE